MDEPPLDAAGRLYLRAFWDLSTCRALGFGYVGPIPWDAILAYGQQLNLESDVLSAFVQIIRELDAGCYLRWQAREAERKRIAEKPPLKGTR